MLFRSGYRLVSPRPWIYMLCCRKAVNSYKEVLLPLVLGIWLGVLVGQIWVAEHVTDVPKHNVMFEDEKVNFTIPFFLRCVVMMHPKTPKPLSFIAAVRDTYARDCNQTIFYTSSDKVADKVTDQRIFLVESDSNAHYWKFYHYVMQVSAEQAKDSVVLAYLTTPTRVTVPAQWTVLLDEKTLLHVPNLRRILQNYDPKQKLMFGRVLLSHSLITSVLPFISQERVAMQAGVVLSNSAIDALASCNRHFFPRTTETALYQCSQKHDIQLIDPTDEDNMHLLHYEDFKKLINTAREADVSSEKDTVAQTGCCSDHAISFGQQTYKEIRMAHFSSRHWRVFGMGGVEHVNASFAIDPKLLNKPATTKNITKAIPPKKLTPKNGDKKVAQKANLLT